MSTWERGGRDREEQLASLHQGSWKELARSRSWEELHEAEPTFVRSIPILTAYQRAERDQKGVSDEIDGLRARSLSLPSPPPSSYVPLDLR